MEILEWNSSPKWVQKWDYWIQTSIQNCLLFLLNSLPILTYYENEPKFLSRSGSCGVRVWGNLSLLPVFKTLLLKRLRLDPSSLIFNMLKLSFTRPRPPSPVTIMLSSPILNHCRKFEIFLMKMFSNAVVMSNFGNIQYSTPSSDGQMTILTADI